MLHKSDGGRLVALIDRIVRNYGAPTAGVKSIVKLIPGIFAHADKGVRAEGSQLVVELSRWIGSAISAAFEGLKPVQVKELQDAIAKTPSDVPPRPLRWRRSEEQASRDERPSAAMDIVALGGGAFESNATAAATNGCGVSTGEIIDAYSLAEPVNVLQRMPANFGEMIDSTKWKERKDVLDALLAVVKVPKIEDGSFGPLTTTLAKKIASDVNVSVVIGAAQCLEALALGLRKKFAPHRTEVIPALLERCKEKNKNVIEALRAALDATLHGVTCAGEICESCGPFFKHKNPQVKAECLGWLARAIPIVFKAPQAKKEIKGVADAANPCLEDGSAEVRDAASAALAALVAVGGERAVAPFLDRVEKAKLAKILELAAASTSNVAPKPSAAAAPASAVVAKGAGSGGNGESGRPAPRSTTATAVAPRPATTRGAASTGAALPKATIFRTKEESLEIMRLVLGDELLAGLRDANWKQRLNCMDSISAKFDCVFPPKVDADVLALFFSEYPGWRESNFQVLAKMLAVLTSYAEKVAFTAEAAGCVIQGAAEKISDAKLGTGVGLLFLAMAERVGLASCLNPLMGMMAGMKNPRSLSETYNWMASAILDFGCQGLDIQAIVACTKNGISNSNAVVRASAVKVAVILRRYLGQPFARLYTDIPQAQQATLEAEFAKVASDPVPQPIRRVKTEETGGRARDLNAPAAADAVEGGVSGSVDIDSLAPRVDVTDAAMPIIREISDANWKVRKEGMERLSELINRSGGRIKMAASSKGASATVG